MLSSSLELSRSLITQRTRSAATAASSGQLSGSIVKPCGARMVHSIYVACSRLWRPYRGCAIRERASREWPTERASGR
jgi:hypothetical protein